MAQSSELRKSSWSFLPAELLEEISGCLPTFSDHVRFHSVCASWRSAARPRLHHPQPPWLIVAPYEVYHGASDFFSLSSNKIHHLVLPAAQGKQCCGSSHGWLFLQHGTSSVSLLNPFTGTQLPLPPLHSSSSIRTAILSSDPSMDPESMALVILPYNVLGFCRVGGEGWTVVHDHRWSLDHIHDVIFYKGQIYVIGLNGRLAFCDIGPSAKLTLIPSVHILEHRKNYLVEFSGELFLVARYMSYEHLTCKARTDGFRVFKIDLSGRPKLLAVDNMDCMLFVGPNQSLSLASGYLNGFDGNCIYFVEDHYMHGRMGDVGPIICVFRLEDGSIEQLPYGLNRVFFGSPESQWITPSIRF